MSKRRHENQKLVANEAVKTTCTFSILIWLVGSGCARIDGMVYMLHGFLLCVPGPFIFFLFPFYPALFALHLRSASHISITHTLCYNFFPWPLGLGVNVYGASRRQRQLKNEGHLLLSTDCYLVNVCMRSSAIFRYNCVYK